MGQEPLLTSLKGEDVAAGRRLREVKRVLLDSAVGCYGCVVPKGAWHTVEVLAPSVIHLRGKRRKIRRRRQRTVVVAPLPAMVFHKYFQAGKKEEFRQKSTFFSPLRWRLSIFGQINIGRIPCLGFSFFVPFLGELSAAAFCYGIRFYCFGFGVRVWVNCWAIWGSGIRMMFAVGEVKPKKLMLPYHTIELSMMAHCSVCSVMVFT